MSPDRREILEQVASGDITPEQADQLLRSLDEEGPRAPATSDTAAASGAGIKMVRIRADFGAIRIEGDPTVAEAEIDGRHTATIDGDVLVIRAESVGDMEPRTPGVFAINLGGRRKAQKVRTIRLGTNFGGQTNPLRIRMNPALALDAKLDAGPLSIKGVTGIIRARSGAGPISVDGFESPLDISVNAGAIRAIGRLLSGDSRINSDAGAVRVALDPSSSVHIIAEAALGKVVLPGSDPGSRRRFGSRSEATIGEGDATLRVETAMGSILVSVE